MASNEDRMRILSLVEEGKISAEEGARLLAAMNQGGSVSQAASSAGATSSAVVHAPSAGAAKWLKVKVTDQATGRLKVDVTIPLALVRVAARFGGNISPELRDLDIEEVIEAARSGESGRLVDVLDAEDGEHVEVFIQ